MEPEADVRDGSDEQAEDMSFDLTSTLTILVTGGVLLLGVAAVVLIIWALFSILLQPAITGERKAVWVLLVIALPLLGSLGWPFLGRPDARRQLAAVGQG